MGFIDDFLQPALGFIPGVGGALNWGIDKLQDFGGTDTGKQVMGGLAGYGINQLMGGGQAQQGFQQMDAYSRLMMDMKRKQMEMAINEFLPQMMENKRQGLRGIQDIRSAYTADRPSSFGMSREDFQPMRGLRGPETPINLPRVNFKDEGYKVPDYSNFVPTGREGMDDAILEGSFFDEERNLEGRDDERDGYGDTRRGRRKGDNTYSGYGQYDY